MSNQRLYRQCTARNGQGYVLREARLADAAQLIAHMRSVLAEPEWSVTELDEFQVTVDQEEAWILSFKQRPHSILLVADFGSSGEPNIVGSCNFTTQPRKRVRHRGRLGIGVQAAYRGLGVGEALLRALLEWAEAEPELERIELSVFPHNTRAINLYRKLGFIEEARLERSFKLADGTYYDDIMMVKWVKE